MMSRGEGRPKTQRMDTATTMGGLLTAPEVAALEQLRLAWRAFEDLPRCHASELEEGRAHLHGLQLLLMARAAVRAYPDLFTHVEGFK